MFLTEVKNLQFHSQFSLRHIEDRLILTAEFPEKFCKQNQLIQPFLYVTLYVRGGVAIKILDEGKTGVYTLSKKQVEPETYQQIIQFAKKHAPQFKLLTATENK